MKATKLAGIRLKNYIKDGINWKDHRDIVFDFWKQGECKNSGVTPNSIKEFNITDELPTKVRESYERWFNEFNFQKEDDKKWLEFIDGTLNLFYHTENPIIMPDETWYVMLIKSELEATTIVEEQVFHGDPNINSFWKMDTNTKPNEVSGRRNGYLYTRELASIKPRDTNGFYWAVAFQSPESVKLSYIDTNELKSKCINWAANCKNHTLLKITNSGRFQVIRTFVPGKAWRNDRYIPQEKTPKNPLIGSTLVKYNTKNFFYMYGIWEDIDDNKKSYKEAVNQRKNAISTMNDEEIKITKIIDNIDGFIRDGNVDPETREYNKTIRRAIRDKNKLRDRELRKKVRQLQKDKRKQEKKNMRKMSSLFK